MRQLTCVVSVTIAILCASCGRASDETITSSVRAGLATATTIDASQVTVLTNGQVVTLRGTVPTAAAKEEAVRVARAASGVRDVVDELRVVPPVAASAAPADTGTGSSVTTAVATAPGTATTAGTTADSGNAVTNAAKTTGNAIVEGAKATGNATVKGAEVAGEATVDAAKATGNATVKGAEATASGFKKLGSSVAGAVTPDKDEKK
jgi:hypothetical protein